MRKFILGTDWWTDCDDAVALRLICNSVKRHKIKLCGVIINACMEHSVCSMDGFLSKEKLDNIPIGIDLNGTDFRGSKHSYQKRLANYATRFKNNPSSRMGGSIFCEKCPVPVTFSGFEVGNSIITGGNLDPKDHLFDVLNDWGCSATGRDSWDPITALLAVIGDESEAGYDTVVGTASVDLSDGCNHFKKHDGGMHRYVVKVKDDSFYQDMINGIIPQI